MLQRLQCITTINAIVSILMICTICNFYVLDHNLYARERENDRIQQYVHLKDFGSSLNQTVYDHLLQVATENTFSKRNLRDHMSPSNVVKAVLPPHQKATLVIMSNSVDRKEQVEMLLWLYSQMVGVLDKIVFVWNSAEEAPPGIVKLQNLYNRDRFVKFDLFMAKENLLTNRYRGPSEMASPNAPILLVDDDVFIDQRLIYIMLKHWREDEKCQEKCILGLDPRSVNLRDASYSYTAPYGTTANLAITKTMLVHVRYLKLFMKDQNLVSRASMPGCGCDDLSFSLFQTTYSGLIPRFLSGDIHYIPDPYVKESKYFSPLHPDLVGGRYDLPELGSQSGKIGWTEKRHDCVRWSLNHFGSKLISILRKASL